MSRRTAWDGRCGHFDEGVVSFVSADKLVVVGSLRREL
jgi:hypothetical protein